MTAQEEVAQLLTKRLLCYEYDDPDIVHVVKVHDLDGKVATICGRTVNTPQVFMFGSAGAPFPGLVTCSVCLCECTPSLQARRCGIMQIYHQGLYSDARYLYEQWLLYHGKHDLELCLNMQKRAALASQEERQMRKVE